MKMASYVSRDDGGKMSEVEERLLASKTCVHPLLCRILREVVFGGPLDSAFVSAASLHRLRRVNKYFKSVAERHLRALPDVLVFGGATYSLGSPGICVRRSGEALSMLSLRWREAPEPPFARTAAACCALGDGRVFLGGGCSRNDCGVLLCECCEEASADCAIFDPKTLEWTELPELPVALAAARPLPYNDGILLVGGARPPRLDVPEERVVRVPLEALEEDVDDDDDDELDVGDDGRIALPVQPANIWGDVDLKFWRGTSDLWKLDLQDSEECSWKRLEATLPRPLRGGGCCEISRGRFVLAGEYWPSFVSAGKNGLETLVSSSIDSWHLGAPMDDLRVSQEILKKKKRTRMRATKIAEELVQCSALRGGSAAVDLGGSRVLMVGGKTHENDCHDRLRLYDADLDTWTLLPCKLPSPVDGQGLTRIGCSVIFCGGSWREFQTDRENVSRDNASNQVSFFDLDTNKVYELPPMLLDRADPSVANCNLLKDNPAYDTWAQHRSRHDDLRYQDNDRSQDLFISPPALAGCAIS